MAWAVPPVMAAVLPIALNAVVSCARSNSGSSPKSMGSRPSGMSPNTAVISGAISTMVLVGSISVLIFTLSYAEHIFLLYFYNITQFEWKNNE